jgi:hypothetical protein
LCGILDFITGVGPLLAAGGVLMLPAAYLVWTRPADPVNRMFDALPNPGFLRGQVRRALVACVLAFIGGCWIVVGVAA